MPQSVICQEGLDVGEPVKVACRWWFGRSCKRNSQQLLSSALISAAPAARAFTPQFRTSSKKTLKAGVLHINRLWTADLPGDDRNICVVAVTGTNRLPALKVSPSRVFDKGGQEMLAGLLTIADNVNSSLFLVAEDQSYRILFACPR